MSHQPEYDTLEQFFIHFKLPHRMTLLCEKLGIESVEDLKDVRPNDLHDLTYKCWAQEHLTVVERNRFSRAVAFVDNITWRDGLPKTGQAPATLVDGDNFE